MLPLLQAAAEDVWKETTIFTQTVLDGTQLSLQQVAQVTPLYAYGTELKNLMERFIQNIKDRTECFDDHFPCRKVDCNRKHVWNWLKLFLLYLDMGTDRMRFTLFLARDGG